MVRCVFFDRDGIVNRWPGRGYVTRWEDFHLLPAFVDVLRTVGELGYEAVIVTNQSGVARGVMSLEAVESIHARFRDRLAAEHGLELLDVLCCPHDEGECECRKPKPGMLLEAAARHGIDLPASWMVGDSERDIEAGRAAGCRTVLVDGEGEPTRADFFFPTLELLSAEAARLFGERGAGGLSESLRA
jgi:D-glycero-D-manno-heptose 1,7-bisphosphate phosphatase